MAIREYIGARYVPKFYDDGQGGAEWTSTVEFEPLTVVLYQGNSYTSRQYVPIGIDIMNTDYWLETGNWNSQVEQYRKEVAAFDGRITTNTEAINAEATARDAADTVLRDRIAAEETARTAADTVLRDRIAAEEAARAAADATLESKISVASKIVNVVVIGDSWADGWNGSTSITNWAAHMASYAGITTMRKISEGGAGFAAGGQNTGRTFNAMLQELAGTLTQAQRSAVQIVIGAGGVNDRSYSETQIKSGISGFCSTAKAQFPNAKILIAGLSCINTLETWNSWKVLRAYTDCGAYRAAYITNIEYAALKCEYAADGAHLTNYAPIGRYMAQAIQTGSVDIQVLGTITFKNNDDSAVSSGGSANLMICNDAAMCSISDLRFTPNNITTSWNAFTTIGKWECDIPAVRQYGFQAAAVATFYSNGVWIGCPARIELQGNGNVRIACCPPSGLSLTGVTQVNVTGPWLFALTAMV